MATIGIIAGSALIAGAGAYGAKSGADASEEANSTNLMLGLRQQELEERMFRESRGAGGLPVFTPLYGGSFESGNLWPAATSTFNLAFPSQEADRVKRLNDLRKLQAGIAPTFELSQGVGRDIFSGALTDERLASAKPVTAARTAVGRTSKAAIVQGLKERLNAISAQSKRAGYSGSGTTAGMAGLRATISANQQAAQAEAQAEMENALMIQGIQDQGINLKLQNLNLPTQQFNQAAQFQTAPEAALIAQYEQALRPFQFFNINPQAMRPTPISPVQPVANTGQVVGAGVSQVANTLGNYYANRQIADMYQKALTQNYVQGTAAGMTPAVNAGMLPASSSSAVDWSLYGA